MTFCTDCGEPLRRDNATGVCAECRWNARNARLLAAQREHERQRRRQAVQELIAEIEGQQ